MKVGFPIRKFTGQSLFAAHRNLSQRTTSFIASCRQGIHRMLLGHLIALINNAHLRKRNDLSRFGGRKLFPAPSRHGDHCLERPVCIEISPAGVLRLAAPILYARPYRSASDRGTIIHQTAMHGQHRRYRLLSRHIPSSRCQECTADYFTADQCTLLFGTLTRAHSSGSLVEPDGIEPTTSCLQSTRSPS